MWLNFLLVVSWLLTECSVKGSPARIFAPGYPNRSDRSSSQQLLLSAQTPCQFTSHLQTKTAGLELRCQFLARYTKTKELP
jgi:hypothetical protein